MPEKTSEGKCHSCLCVKPRLIVEKFFMVSENLEINCMISRGKLCAWENYGGMKVRGQAELVIIHMCFAFECKPQSAGLFSL